MNSDKKKVLVTGGNGFIGSQLIKTLRKNEISVTTVTSNDGDIRSIDLNDFGKFDQVIHLANRNFIPESWDNPGTFFSVNIDGTRNVLEFCRLNNARLIYISAYVYGQPNYLPIDENHSITGINPYMKSKVLTEELVQFYSKFLDVSSVIIRPFNIYGVGQRESYLIPTIVSQIKSSKNKEISLTVKSLKPKRDFLHIEDFNRALIAILKHKEIEGIYNLGSGRSYSVEQIIQTCSKILNTPIEYFEENSERPNEVLDVVADISKINKHIGWSPSISLEKGLSQILNHAL